MITFTIHLFNYGRRFLICYLLLWSALNSITAQKDILTEADQMPYFAGCESLKDGSPEKRTCSNKNLVQFIEDQLVYPSVAKQLGIEGVVYVSFVVNAGGIVEAPSIIRDIGGECGAAALKVVGSMPPWEPAVHQGTKVSVSLNLPVRFYVREDAIAEEASTYQINWGSLTSNVITKESLEELTQKSIHVRDAYGNEKAISELIFAYERKKSYLEESSAGKINNDMKDLIAKCKKGGKFLITVVIQVKNDYIYVKRTLDII
jgi:TonB family protein